MQLCAARPGPVTVDPGLTLDVPHGLEPVARAQTVVVPPTSRPDDVDPAVLQALVRAHRRGARIMSLCTGAFVLAAAGLLDGRRATTHWMDADELVRRHPRVTVDPDVLYVDEGSVLTSAGVAASIDLCLYVVRQDWGSEAANSVAKRLVVAPHRDGGQAQYIEAPVPVVPDADPLGASMAWATAHLDHDVTVTVLARRAAVSPRTFARLFLARTGTTPYRWVTRQRVVLAQRLLESTDLPVEVVAARSGLGSGVNLRKHFQAVLRTTPLAYRRAFRRRGAAR